MREVTFTVANNGQTRGVFTLNPSIDEFNQLQWLIDMQRLRNFEEAYIETSYPYLGEEAVATGVISLLDHKDNVGGIYREHVYAFLRGININRISENNFWGNRGSLQIYHKGGQLYSGLPKSLELAYLAKKDGEERRTICFFNEKAIADESFIHVVNMAQQWGIPILFCCENSDAQTDFSNQIKDYFIESAEVDGINIFDVVEKTKQALGYIKDQQKPYFLEFKTHRFSLGTKDIAFCPIENLKNKMLRNNILTLPQWDEMKQSIKNEQI